MVLGLNSLACGPILGSLVRSLVLWFDPWSRVQSLYPLPRWRWPAWGWPRSPAGGWTCSPAGSAEQGRQHQHCLQVWWQDTALEYTTVHRIGQETVEEIVSRTQEVFSILKSLQPPVGSFNQQTQQHDKSNQEKQNRLQDVLKGIGMLFKRLRVCWEKCQENTGGMDFMPIESLIPLKVGQASVLLALLPAHCCFVVHINVIQQQNIFFNLMNRPSEDSSRRIVPVQLWELLHTFK